MTSETKTCSKCLTEKALSDFSKQGAHAWCKACSNNHSRAYRAANLKQIRAQQVAAKREHPARHLLQYAKARANERGVPFSLRENDIVIPTHCPVLGIKLECLNKQGPASPTLDRIIPELGYVPSNVVVISWRANRLKSDATLEELQRLTTWLQNRQDKPVVEAPHETHMAHGGHPNRKVLRPEQEIRLSEEYLEGATMAALAAQYECSISTVSYTLRRLGVPARPSVANRHKKVEGNLTW